MDISPSYIDNQTLTGADAVLQQYEIALFTTSGSWGPDPTFGFSLEYYLSEPNTPQTATAIKSAIVAVTKSKFPQIQIESIKISRPTQYQVSIDLRVVVVPYGAKALIQKTI